MLCNKLLASFKNKEIYIYIYHISIYLYIYIYIYILYIYKIYIYIFPSTQQFVLPNLLCLISKGQNYMVSKGFPSIGFRNEGDGVKIMWHCETLQFSLLMRGLFIQFGIQTNLIFALSAFLRESYYLIIRSNHS